MKITVITKWLSLIILAGGINAPSRAHEQEPTEAPTTTAIMTQEKMLGLLETLVTDMDGDANNISFRYQGAAMALVSDIKANRMRIVTPIISAGEISQEQLVATMLSNYHLALDARYALGDGILYSVYIHPLKELSGQQLKSAIRQVATLKATFGSSYTSGELLFGLGVEQETVEL